MMKSEQDNKTLYESFINRVSIEEQIKTQNKYITIILGCLIIGAVLLLCILII
jgi:hypothetical protein